MFAGPDCLRRGIARHAEKFGAMYAAAHASVGNLRLRLKAAESDHYSVLEHRHVPSDSLREGAINGGTGQPDTI